MRVACAVWPAACGLCVWTVLVKRECVLGSLLGSGLYHVLTGGTQVLSCYGVLRGTRHFSHSRLLKFVFAKAAVDVFGRVAIHAGFRPAQELVLRFPGSPWHCHPSPASLCG